MSARELAPEPSADRQDLPVAGGAAFIDEQGNEVPITEAMIRNACEELARNWHFPRQVAA